MAEATETASPALIRKFCEGLKRQIVIGPKLNLDMRREAVVDRLITTIQPHTDAGKPRLWSLGGNDHAVSQLPWPLSQSAEVANCEDHADAAPAARVVSLAGKRGKK
ncbi:hypothetical protein [Methylovirgula ligni]|uniref:hypothetical protein n=1 Tax=Methylovirgula ligni TaxID=569860 RepID=UPI001FE04244|nr:hypothetical protein [Methylovirgula ligni]